MAKRKKSIIEDSAKIEILKQGMTTEFWKIIMEAMEESKEDIQKKQDSEEMKDLPGEQYKLFNELFKAKKDLIDALKNTPDNLISWLTKPEEAREKNFDPYGTAKDQ